MVHGSMHSRNAREAELRGELPITRAVEVTYKALECKKLGISRRVVREFLEKNCRAGWHHVAGPSRVREVPYYATVLTEEQQSELLKNPPVWRGSDEIRKRASGSGSPARKAPV